MHCGGVGHYAKEQKEIKQFNIQETQRIDFLSELLRDTEISKEELEANMQKQNLEVENIQLENVQIENVEQNTQIENVQLENVEEIKQDLEKLGKRKCLEK